MMPEKRKAAVALILGKMKPEPSPESESEPSSASTGLEVACEEFATASASKDWKAAAVALKSFIEQCGHTSYGSEDDDDEEP